MQAFSARASLSGNRLTISSPAKNFVPRDALSVEAKEKTRTERNRARHRRVRNKVSGTSERPRLAVFRSHRHIHAQVIDDTALNGNGTTLAAVSTLSKVIRENDELKTGADKAAAEEVGKQLGAICLERGIKKVVFDRGGFRYFGRVQALADGAREAGLEF